MSTAIVLFTRDLRVHDHPALHAACRTAERVVPLFVLDDAILSSPFAAPNRLGFLLESLADLRTSLRAVGGDLVVRRGTVADAVATVAADTGAGHVHLSADVSAYARDRERRLRDRLAPSGVTVTAHPGVTIVAPGTLAPAGGNHYRVFTPYWRAWQTVHRDRSVHPAPARIRLPAELDAGTLPERRGPRRGGAVAQRRTRRRDRRPRPARRVPRRRRRCRRRRIRRRPRRPRR